MTRRIVRTLIQLAIAISVTCTALLFLDRNYRVLPDSIHSHLPGHHPGHVVTDVTVVTCSRLSPLSSCDMDPTEWHRLPKELYLRSSWFSEAYVYIKRKHEEELTEEDKVVIDLGVGRTHPEDKEPSEDKWEARPSGLWLKRTSSKQASDSDQAVTDIDVLFGEDAVEVRDGWSLLRGTPLKISSSPSQHSIQITVRRGTPKQHKKPVLHVPENGKFKILQLADLHLSNGVGVCRDAIPDSYNGGPCEADPRTFDFVVRMIEEEKPQLVVLSGDQVNGETAKDPQSAIFKIIGILKEHKMPWAAIFGNHDDLQGVSRQVQMEVMEGLPFSLTEAGPSDIAGVGNYYLEIYGRKGSENSAITIYFIDTHSVSPDKKYPGYDWVKPSQIEWFKKTARGLKKAHSEYSHQHLDISFIHIPLTEYTDYNNTWVGGWTEGVTAPVYNTGFRDALVEQGVVMVSAGHDHCNDYCIPSPEGEDKKPTLWLCYGGGVGFGGYGGYQNYIRRARIYEIQPGIGQIMTWKRLEHGDENALKAKIDHQILVEGGNAMPAPVPRPPVEQAAPPPPPPGGEKPAA